MSMPLPLCKGLLPVYWRIAWTFPCISKRETRLCQALLSFGYELMKPEGAFYLFPKTPLEDDVAFVGALQDENILTVPGSGFGGPGHFRIAYCVSDQVIEKALPGFEKIIKKY